MTNCRLHNEAKVRNAIPLSQTKLTLSVDDESNFLEKVMQA